MIYWRVNCHNFGNRVHFSHKSGLILLHLYLQETDGSPNKDIAYLWEVQVY